MTNRYCKLSLSIAHEVSIKMSCEYFSGYFAGIFGIIMHVLIDTSLYFGKRL